MNLTAREGVQGFADTRLDTADLCHRRLVWLYGAERAGQIRLGNDPKTNADIQKWNTLGRRA